MDDLLPTFSFEGVGATALLVIAVLLVFTGRLVPRSMVGHISAERDARIKELREEADRWMKAFMLSQEENAELLEQIQASIKQGETTVAVLQSIQEQT